MGRLDKPRRAAMRVAEGIKSQGGMMPRKPTEGQILCQTCDQTDVLPSSAERRDNKAQEPK